MMTIEDYALDVGKTIDEIKALCDKIGINYEDEKTPLDETDIILLDNEQQFSDPFLSYTSYIIHEVASPSIKSFIPTDQVHAPLIDLSVDSST